MLTESAALALDTKIFSSDAAAEGSPAGILAEVSPMYKGMLRLSAIMSRQLSSTHRVQLAEALRDAADQVERPALVL